MSRRHHIRAQLAGGLEKGVKLYLAVAEHVRVGRTPLGILIEHIIHDLGAVFPAQVHKVERNAYLAGNHLSDEAVLFPLAVAVKRAFGVVPVLHKHRKHVITLPFEQQRSHAGVHASRKSYTDFHRPAPFSASSAAATAVATFMPSIALETMPPA